jgi:hypothetical protein
MPSWGVTKTLMLIAVLLTASVAALVLAPLTRANLTDGQGTGGSGDGSALTLSLSDSVVGYVAATISGPAGATVDLGGQQPGGVRPITRVVLPATGTLRIRHALEWLCTSRQRVLVATIAAPTPTPPPPPPPPPDDDDRGDDGHRQDHGVRVDHHPLVRDPATRGDLGQLARRRRCDGGDPGYLGHRRCAAHRVHHTARGHPAEV